MHSNNRALTAFFALLGGSVLACIASDIVGGVWKIHSGEVFPWRHLPGIPLYGSAGLIAEWIIGIAGAALLISQRSDSFIRIGEGLALVSTAMGLSQRFSNHRSLILIVLVFAMIGNLRDRNSPNAALLRSQLVVVYLFSVVNKIAHGFDNGDALTNLFGWSADIARIASWMVLAMEIVIPILLLTRARTPVRIGFGLAIALHTSMAILMPEVVSFSLVMIALGALFLDTSTQKSSVSSVSTIAEVR